MSSGLSPIVIVGYSAMTIAAIVSDLGQRRGQTVDDIIERLREAILAGRIVPGQRLVANDLTGQLGVGRGSVREAFQRLASDGLVEIIPNRGAIVRRLSRDQVRELFQIRVNLEGLAARLAAENINENSNRARFLKIWNEVKPKGASPHWPLFMRLNRKSAVTDRDVSSWTIDAAGKFGTLSQRS